MSHPTVFPSVTYDDAPAAIDFLVEAFGAERHAVHTGDDGAVRHAELRFGNGIVMLGPAWSDMPATRGGSIYVVIGDVDAHCERARAAGAEVIREPHDTDYGSRDYGARDREGNSWWFGTYQPFAFAHEQQEAARA
jgi:uncharacterized glyoxalase superfamily protein PhnB